jgi:hypothetical protein
MTLFPYVVEYEADQSHGGGVSHNSADKLSENGAQDLFALLRESPRTRWARWYRVGVEGDRAEYYREDDARNVERLAYGRAPGK